MATKKLVEWRKYKVVLQVTATSKTHAATLAANGGKILKVKRMKKK